VQDEFRPGVEHRDDTAIDITDEFERQFFGDVMLFSVVAWLKHHDLAQLTDGAQLGETVLQVEAELLEIYAAKHRAMNARLAELQRWLADAPHAWRGTPALQQLAQFLRNMEANFGDAAPAWRQIQSAGHREQRRQQIVDALTHYRAERAAWDRLVTQ